MMKRQAKIMLAIFGVLLSILILVLNSSFTSALCSWNATIQSTAASYNNTAEFTNNSHITWSWTTTSSDCGQIKFYMVRLLSGTSVVDKKNITLTNWTNSISLSDKKNYTLEITPLNNSSVFGTTLYSKTLYVDRSIPSLASYVVWPQSKVGTTLWVTSKKFWINETISDTNTAECIIKIGNGSSKSLLCQPGLNMLSFDNICNIDGKNACVITETIKDKAGNAKTTTLSLNINANGPSTSIKVNSPGIASQVQGIDYFVTNKTDITLTCADSFVGCNSTYYSIKNSSGAIVQSGASSTGTLAFRFNVNDNQYTLEYYSKNKNSVSETPNSEVFYITSNINQTIQGMGIKINNNLTDGMIIKCDQNISVVDDTNTAGGCQVVISNSTGDILRTDLVYSPETNSWTKNLANLEMLKEGSYTLKLVSRTASGNALERDLNVRLPKIACVNLESDSCTVNPLIGGECTYKFNAKVRGGNAIQMSLDNINGLAPQVLNAKIFSGDDSAFIGGTNSNGPVWNGGTLKLMDANYGDSSFTLDLTLPQMNSTSQSLDGEYYLKPTMFIASNPGNSTNQTNQSQCNQTEKLLCQAMANNKTLCNTQMVTQCTQAFAKCNMTLGSNICQQNPSNSTNITIDSFEFSPSTLAITQGQTVTWTNEDPTQHTITSNTGSELNSPTLSSGQTYSHTFNTKGTFDYHCNINQFMAGEIVVN